MPGKDQCPPAGRSILVAFIVMFISLAMLSEPAQCQHYKVIYNFTGQGSDGESPYGGPMLDAAGNLYGTTYAGGSLGSGSVYRLSPHGSSWTYTSLYSFRAGLDGVGPGFGTLAFGPGHILYGTTEGGGAFGTAFALGKVPQGCSGSNCQWHETVVHTFGNGTDGGEPIGGVVFDANGNFYGTTLLGGDYANGTVYEVSGSGQNRTENVLYSFGGSTTDAINPVAALTLDSAGNLYGTAPSGGAYGYGAVFKLSHSGSGWTETVLYSFQGLNDGQNPVGGLVLDKAGNLYGGTFFGGANGGGTLYELSPSATNWNLTTLYSFSGFGGPYNKLAFDTNGNLYGITNSDGPDSLGSVFKLTPGSSGWTFSDLYDFVGGNSGRTPYGGLAVDSEGNIFGTADEGGTNNGGVIFEITP